VFSQMTLSSAIQVIAQRQLSQLRHGRLAVQAPKALYRAVERLRKRFGGGLQEFVNNDRISKAVEKLKEQGVDSLTGGERYVIAYGLAAPIGALSNGAIVDEPELLGPLLQRWSRDIDSGTLRAAVWRGLFRSYLQTPPGEGAAHLRQVLARGLMGVTSRAHGDPAWLRTVLRHKDLLGESPCRLYVTELLEGRRVLLDDLSNEFPPPTSSWFWDALASAICQQADRLDDDAFKSRIPLFLGLTELNGLISRRDGLLARILDRHARTADRACHDQLLAYALEHWKNPQLRTSLRWVQVAESTRQMVCGWLALEDLEDFYQLCQDERRVDESRLKYWLRFKEQIVFSQIVLGTTLNRSSDPDITKFKERKKGRLARLISGTNDDNALITQIGDWVFVAFSAKGDACYPYKVGNLPIELGRPSYFLHELKSKRAVLASDARTFLHLRDWQVDFDDTLRFWGLRPDAARRMNGPASSERLPSPATVPPAGPARH
jgi:hypothetical protein